MMRARILTLTLLTALTTTMWAADDKAKAEALVKEAIAFANKSGRDQMLDEVNKPKGRFHVAKEEDLYVFVFTTKGMCLANGADVRKVGQDRWMAKDPTGKFHVQDFCNVAVAKGKGWTEHKTANPKTQKLENKIVYSEFWKDLVICSGVYKP